MLRKKLKESEDPMKKIAMFLGEINIYGGKSNLTFISVFLHKIAQFDDLDDIFEKKKYLKLYFSIAFLSAITGNDDETETYGKLCLDAATKMYENTENSYKIEDIRNLLYLFSM